MQVDNKNLPQKKLSIIRQIGRILHYYLDMPQIGPPTLPELLLAKTGLSWPVASFAVGFGLYAIFLIIGAIDGTLNTLIEHKLWRASFLHTAMTIYLLLIQPFFKRLLQNAIETFRPLLPATHRFERLVAQAYSLDRKWEIVSITIGVIGGWVMERGLVFNQTWGQETTALTIYTLLGGGLVFGLTGWHIYSVLARTKLLVALYIQAQDLNIFKQSAPFAPIGRWSTGVILGLLAGIPISTFFVGLKRIVRTPPIDVYGIFILVALLFITFNKVPASFLSRISLLRSLILFLIVALVGTFGFNHLEGWPLIDSLYTTIITMTTVGYGDFSPQSRGGRIFTVILSLSAIGIVGYAASSLASLIVEGNFEHLVRKKVYKQIAKLNDHIIICGAGRVGKWIAIELYKTKVPFVVIENEDDSLAELLHEAEILYIQGDATQDETLEMAGIGRAKGLITSLSDDKDNAFVILSARELSYKLNNKNLRIISRVNDDKQAIKLIRAGADQVISPNMVGGRRMAKNITNAEVVTFLDEMTKAEQQTGQILRLEEVYIKKIKNPILRDLIDKDSLFISKLGRHTGLLVVAIKRKSAEENNYKSYYIYTPDSKTKLKNDDILIVIGTPEERIKLKGEEKTSRFSNLQLKIQNIFNTQQDRL